MLLKKNNLVFISRTPVDQQQLFEIHIIHNDIAITANIIPFQAFNNNKQLREIFEEIRSQLTVEFHFRSVRLRLRLRMRYP